MSSKLVKLAAAAAMTIGLAVGSFNAYATREGAFAAPSGLGFATFAENPICDTASAEKKLTAIAHAACIFFATLEKIEGRSRIPRSAIKGADCETVNMHLWLLHRPKIGPRCHSGEAAKHR